MDTYKIKEDNGQHIWTDEMIEGLVEEEKVSNVNSITQDRVDKLACKIDEELPSGNPYEWECPEGYQFVDENGNIINATKIVLEKKKKEYPKTYEECCKVLHYAYGQGITMRGVTEEEEELFRILIVLKRCRDAYWKIAGEEMGLGKPWEPNWGKGACYTICCNTNQIVIGIDKFRNSILAFPTEEMRDAFYENFKKEIEMCKKLL